MRPLPDDIRTWLLEASPELAGGPARARDVRLARHIARPDAHIFFCELLRPSGTTLVCVKQFASGERERLLLFQRAAHLRPAMAASTIRHADLLACNPSLGVLVMRAVPGISLEQKIVASCFRGRAAFSECKTAVEHAADQLAELHELAIPAAAPMARSCSNAEYVERLRRTALSSAFVAGTLAGSAFDPERIIGNLPDGFWQRQEVRLLHGDFQAKNILVDGSARPALIDIDYGSGHPLRDVAQFLTQLERLHRRWRIPRARNMLHAYGTAFCEQYARAGFAYLMEDLPFFRLWTIAFSLLPDEHSSWPARRIIRYGLRRGGGVIFRPAGAGL